MMAFTTENRLAAAAALLLSLWADPGQAADGLVPALPVAPFQLPPLNPAQTTVTPIGSTGQVQVERIDFAGNTALTSAELQAIAAPYVGRVVTAAELETLRHALSQAYVDRGFVNSGVRLPAEIVNGLVVFTVVEGRLAAIRLHGMERLDAGYLTQRLAPDSAPPFNLEALREQFQLLLADPLIARLNARLLPGMTPGEAILDIDVTRSPAAEFSTFVNNYRPASLGAESVGITALIRNLTTQGDVLEASLQSPPLRSLDLRSTVAWQMPLGFAGTRLNVALERGSASVTEEPNRVLDIRSRLSSHDIGISHKLRESLSQQLTIGLNRVSRTNRTWLLGEPFSFTPGDPDGVIQETVWRFWPDYSVRSETRVLALRSTLSWGKNSLQDNPELPDAPRLAKQFQLWLGQAQFTQQLMDNGAQWLVRASVQHTPDRLLSLDGLVLGGVNTVRGYRENLLVRDTGAWVNVEWSYPLLRNPASGWQLTLTPFYDYGWAQNVGQAGQALSSWGLSSRLQWQRFQLDLVLAKRLRDPGLVSGSGSSWQDHGVHAQLAYQF